MFFKRKKNVNFIVWVSVFINSSVCVRDWSGILCERSDNEASKDIAESPTRSGTP